MKIRLSDGLTFFCALVFAGCATPMAQSQKAEEIKPANDQLDRRHEQEEVESRREKSRIEIREAAAEKNRQDARARRAS